MRCNVWKRFLIFGYNHGWGDEPHGGLGDVKEEADTEDEAIAKAKLLQYDTVEVFDCETRQCVWEVS